jgi:hypothetical protein
MHTFGDKMCPNIILLNCRIIKMSKLPNTGADVIFSNIFPEKFGKNIGVFLLKLLLVFAKI